VSFFSSHSDLPDLEENILTPEESAVLDKIAFKIVDRGWSVPSILFLESVKPMNYIGSQVMVFFEPIIQTLFSFKDYTTLRELLEKRASIEILLQKIEGYDAKALVRERRIKKYVKVQKKNWKWYQRYLGVFTPKIELPEDVLKEEEKDK
jgi:hypothetical protein